MPRPQKELDQFRLPSAGLKLASLLLSQPSTSASGLRVGSVAVSRGMKAIGLPLATNGLLMRRIGTSHLTIYSLLFCTTLPVKPDARMSRSGCSVTVAIGVLVILI